MKWFRDNLGTGAKLALFALAVQIVLSLGHLHLDDVHAADATAITQVQAPATPDSDHQQHRAGVPCDICAVMAMAGTALFAVPPILQLPDATEIAFAAIKAEFDHLESISGAQHARGPPSI